MLHSFSRLYEVCGRYSRILEKHGFKVTGNAHEYERKQKPNRNRQVIEGEHAGCSWKAGAGTVGSVER
jgi:hypothetical protein